jgi:hypothetical protein
MTPKAFDVRGTSCRIVAPRNLFVALLISALKCPVIAHFALDTHLEQAYYLGTLESFQLGVD